MKFNLGFFCGGLYAITGFIILTSILGNAKPLRDFPPRKPPVEVHGRDCYIDGEVIAPSDLIFISMEDL